MKFIAIAVFASAALLAVTIPSSPMGQITPSLSNISFPKICEEKIDGEVRKVACSK